MSSRRSFQTPVSRSTASDRLAVEASVTNSPVRRWMIHASVVVTTPLVVRLSRSHLIFGAEK
jgi:hypothetical protein